MDLPDMKTLDRDIKAIGKQLAPLQMLLQPYFEGMEYIPTSRPLMFVGNHTIYGVLDVPFLYLELNKTLGICLRPLGDHIHFKIPIWREFISRLGVVEGEREACRQLLEDKQCVPVFPGGAREVAKRRGEKYQLQWGERLGFVKMALASGCTIVPFAALGADDAYDIVWDADDVMNSAFGMLLSHLGVRQDAILPISRGLGGTGLPRPERLYFKFMKPVTTDLFDGNVADETLCRHLRQQVADRVNEGIRSLQAFRECDPKRSLRLRVQEAWENL